VLILIGVVGIQLTLESTQALAKLLPFWGAQRLLEHSIDPTISIAAAIPVALLYALALLVAGTYVTARRAPRARGRDAAVVDRARTVARS
jgi:hypothetical protein